jgi:outer membrane protein insertion porin family
VKASLLLLILFLIALGGCITTRSLKDGEKLLYKQNIKGREASKKFAMQNLMTLKPNVRTPVLGPIGAYLYESGFENLDTASLNKRIDQFEIRIDGKILQATLDGKKTSGLEKRKERRINRLNKKITEGNFLMKAGTPLAIYDSIKIEASRQNIKDYLNSKGFYEAIVTVEYNEKNKKVFQKFLVIEGERSFIDSLNYKTEDPEITKLLQENDVNSFLQKGEYYDRENINLERDRINDLLRNNGYFDFSERFVTFEVLFNDSNPAWSISTVINKPISTENHKAYEIDSVIFFSTGQDLITNEGKREGIHYSLGTSKYSTKILDTRLLIRPNESYNYEKLVLTQRQLLSMDMFRFVNINFDTTSVSDKFLAKIQTSPLQKFQLTHEVGLNVSEGFPGPFYNLSLKNRNTFKGLEILQLNGFIGIEGVAPVSDQDGIYRSFKYGATASVTFPRFLTPFNSRDLNLKTFNPRSAISIGFAYTDRPEYIRSNVNATFSYNWQNIEGSKNYTFKLADINLIDTVKIDPEFKKQLDLLASQGNTLYLAFNPSFVSSTSFNATYNFDYANLVEPSSYLRWFAESGGTLYDLFGTALLKNNDYEFYQFVKLQADYRRYWPLKNKSSVVLRLNGGLAQPYGDNKTMPYEKFFFTGGSNSNRAWSPRRLGPGSAFPYLLDEDGNNVLDENGDFVPDRKNYKFEQPGEVLIEMNLEYRTKVVGFLDWAFFVDVGNIWRAQATSEPVPGETVGISPGSSFALNRFYKELAVGLGTGIRLDFSFLVFRLDIGHKIRDPRYELGNRWLKPFGRSGQTIWNIAVGYPF